MPAPPPTRFTPRQPAAPSPAGAERPGQPTAQPFMAAVSSVARGAWALAAANPVTTTTLAVVGLTALILSYRQARRLIDTAPAYLRNVPTTTVMYGGHGLVRALFHLFRQQYGYDLSVPAVNIAGYNNTDGNCLALSLQFRADLLHFGLDTTVTRVASGQHFLVHCPNFIDNAVPGNIYTNLGNVRGWYLFDEHYAVLYRGLYYDTMAGEIYGNFVRDIVLNTVSDQWGAHGIVVFSNANGGNIMQGQNRLVLDRAHTEPGNFYRATLTTNGANYGAFGVVP